MGVIVKGRIDNHGGAFFPLLPGDPGEYLIP
jgi:hypothetical protein